MSPSDTQTRSHNWQTIADCGLSGPQGGTAGLGVQRVGLRDLGRPSHRRSIHEQVRPQASRSPQEQGEPRQAPQHLTQTSRTATSGSTPPARARGGFARSPSPSGPITPGGEAPAWSVGLELDLTDREHHPLAQLHRRVLHTGPGDQRLDDPLEPTSRRHGPQSSR